MILIGNVARTNCPDFCLSFFICRYKTLSSFMNKRGTLISWFYAPSHRRSENHFYRKGKGKRKDSQWGLPFSAVSSKSFILKYPTCHCVILRLRLSWMLKCGSDRTITLLFLIWETCAFCFSSLVFLVTYHFHLLLYRIIVDSIDFFYHIVRSELSSSLIRLYYLESPERHGCRSIFSEFQEKWRKSSPWI